MTTAPTLPLILALDVASTTGCAEGRPGEKPRTWKWRLGSEGATRPERLFSLLCHLSEHLAVSKPRIIAIEAPINVRGMDTLLFLVGAVGVCEAVAKGRGINDIMHANVQDVRGYFIQRRNFPSPKNGGVKDAGKIAVMHRCHELGWEPQGYDESDAAAAWAWACHTRYPRHAQHVEPLLIGSDRR